jgi:hypothetical protein
MEEFEVTNSNVPKSITATSIDSIPELSRNTQTCYNIFFILISIISLILGIKLFIEKETSLLKEFEHYNLLYFFVIVYTFGFFTALLLSIILSLLIYLIWTIILCFKKRIQINSELDLLISEDQKISIISYTFGILIVMLILLYLIAIIIGIYLLLKIKKNSRYKDYIHYFLVYCFILLNILIGCSLFFIFLFVLFCIKPKESIRQKNYKIDDRKLHNIENEIQEAFEQYQNK